MWIPVLVAFTDIILSVMLIYGLRHWLLTMRRLYFRQRPFYHALYESEPPPISILIPMHNEEDVARDILEALLRSDYPADRMEVIPINDHSSDGTARIIDEYARNHPLIRPLHRNGGERGKPAALNEAMRQARNEILMVFDADYLPPTGMLRKLVNAFIDPEVGAVMGRVMPVNTQNSGLPRLLELERAGGYQVGQQARYSCDFIVQYGGTVGGFRKSLALALGGFDPAVLAEDTDLTFQLYIRGYQVAYANRAECYEESPETFDARFNQVRRWACGHTQVMLRQWWPLLRTPFLTPLQKLDGLMLLCVYLISPLLLLGQACALALFLSGALPYVTGIGLNLFLVSYNAVGNFAPFFEVAAAGMLDGMGRRLHLTPLMVLLFVYNNWAVTRGVGDAVMLHFFRKRTIWLKTRRFRTSSEITNES